jgi:hypothetical protein
MTLSKKAGVSWQVILLVLALIMLATGLMIIWFLSGGAQATIAQIFEIISFQWMFQ